MIDRISAAIASGIVTLLTMLIATIPSVLMGREPEVSAIVLAGAIWGLLYRGVRG